MSPRSTLGFVLIAVMATHGDAADNANKSSQLKRLAQDVFPVDCVENPENPDCFPVDPDVPVEPDCEGPDCFEPEIEEGNHSIFDKLVEWMNIMEGKMTSMEGIRESLSSLEGEICGMKSDISALKSGQTTCVAKEVKFGGTAVDKKKKKSTTFGVTFVSPPVVSFGITKLTAGTKDKKSVPRDAIVEIEDSSLTGTGVTFTINKSDV